MTSNSEYSEDVLVSADWVEARLDEFGSDDPDHRIIEVSTETKTSDQLHQYAEEHIPGAIGFSWEEDLSDKVERDILTKEDFEDLLASHGITEDSTVVLYGDGHIPNWFAAFAYWEFKYYGHDDVRLLNGGKEYWLDEDYPTTDEVPEFSEREYSAKGPYEHIRAYVDEVEKAMNEGLPMVDVRSPDEFSGELIAPPELDETAQRGGHIPGASNIPVAELFNEDGTFKEPEDMESLYADHGISGDETVITYCRVGERSSISWYALTELLGYEGIKNYDGSWTEWGSMVKMPVERGEE